MKAYLIPIFAVIVAGGLAGCATESRHEIRLFSGSGPESSDWTKDSAPQVDQRYQGVRIFSVFQTSADPTTK